MLTAILHGRGRFAKSLLGLATFCVLAGCGGPSAKNLIVDQSLAKQSLTTALDAWKAGEKPAALKDRMPSIIVGDPAWDAGAKLTDYKITGERDLGASLNIQVELTMERNGQAIRRNASYIVGTSPVITVMTE